MAKCKICNKKIPNGTEYCKDCMDKGTNKVDESYLDSLLNSVKNSAPTAEKIYKKSNTSTEHIVKNESHDLEQESDSEDFFQFDIGDIEDFDELDFDKDINDFESKDEIDDKELFGEDLSKFFSEDMNQQESFKANRETDISKVTDYSLNTYNEFQEPNEFANKNELNSKNEDSELSTDIREEADNDYLNDILINSDNLSNSGINVDKSENSDESINLNVNDGLKGNADEDLNGNVDEGINGNVDENLNRNVDKSQNLNVDESIDLNINKSSEDHETGEINNVDYDPNLNISDNIGQSDTDSLEAVHSNINDELTYNEVENTMNNLDDDYDLDFSDLLDQLDNNQNANENNAEKSTIDYSASNQSENNEQNDHFDEIDNHSDSGLNDEDDFMSLLNQISADDPVADDVKAINDLMNGVVNEPIQDKGMPSDVGEVFSDALKAVSNLNDPSYNMSDELDQSPDKKGKKDKKAKKSKDKKKKSKKKNDTEDENSLDDASTKKPKISILKRLFGNIEDKNAASKGSLNTSLMDNTGTDMVDLAGSGKPKQDKKVKKAKKGKASKEQNPDDNEKSGKEAKKAKSKKEKKVKKPKSNDIIQVIDELEEDTGRINRLGATIVFVFFILLAIIIYAGSNAISYSLGIEHATNYFNEKEYTLAYDEVDGMKIKDEDTEIYRKILTVMFVNKQLNSYNDYRIIGEYPQALDSLLKGLKRYDKYIELATKLGIKTDMNYVRKQILAELKNQFSLSEEEALNIMNIDDSKSYSARVYNVASQIK